MRKAGKIETHSILLYDSETTRKTIRLLDVLPYFA
jgi:hypothetical protein